MRLGLLRRIVFTAKGSVAMLPLRLVRNVVCMIALLGALPSNAGVSAAARDLAFEERVAAEQALQHANYAHQIGARKSFEAAFPRDVLEKRVRTYLRQSIALETYWKTPITATMLRRERERMERDTRMPERLRELYAALGNDTFLVEECLARATLADRLARNFLAFDERFQGTVRREATEVLRQLSTGELSPRAEHPRRTTRTMRRADAAKSSDLQLPTAEFDEWAEKLVAQSASVPLTDDAEAYRFQVVIDREADHVGLAEYSFPKRSWDEWWTVEGGSLDETRVKAVSDAAVGSAALDLVGDCPVDDTWDPGQLGSIPAAYTYFTAVWTGSTMIVCGPSGTNFFASFEQAVGRYDPETDSWKVASNGISQRRGHTAVWTGTEMLVWGGGSAESLSDLGGRYNPVTDQWTPMSTVGAPELRQWHTAVWTGAEMIIWGGESYPSLLNTGGRYNPSGDTWVATSTGSGVPTPRENHTAVWTGSEMIIWGGYSPDPDDGSLQPVNTGGRYNPSTNTWLATATAAGVPTARADHSAVWTGSRMVVWGGAGDSSGARYDPSTNSWQPTSTVGAPGSLDQQVAVWTGSRMVVWVGAVQGGGRYDPVGDTWSAMSTTNAPLGTGWRAAVWTGTRMVVWEGFRGGRYDPATDTWTPVAGAPGPRYGHSAVWSGTEMIVWGGSAGNTGGRYNLATDSWTPTTTTGAPTGVSGNTAIWSGTEMIVWGGALSNTGGRYNPSSDTWLPTSTGSNVPSPRSNHAAVWTGTEMIVWGGISDTGALNTGGRYNPSSDTWLPTSIGTNVPSPRAGSAAAWTGSKMLIWGGSYPSTFTDGRRYDPSANSWTTMSTAGAPEVNGSAFAVWTGSALFASAGSTGSIGGLYHPATDSWTPTAPLPSTGGSPSGRSAIWAGSRVVLWGGYPNSNGGARYDPVGNDWKATRVAGAPVGRDSHSAIWTGKWMIIWGGWQTGPNQFASGSRYAVSADDDADGFTACAGDCNDHSSGIHPGATEQCNAIDDNCNGAIDDDALGVDSDSDGVHNACDNCIALANPLQQDLDSDSFGDACDNCASEYNPQQNDLDADRLGDVCDNCLFDFNPPQSDFDHDGQGDLCDLNDGLIYIYSTDRDYIEWQGESGPSSWSVYEGDLSVLKATGAYTQAPGSNALAHRTCGVTEVYAADVEVPGAGAVKFALVSGGNSLTGLGATSSGVPRANTNPCP